LALRRVARFVARYGGIVLLAKRNRITLINDAELKQLIWST
jgi:hypothetical protein